MRATPAFQVTVERFGVWRIGVGVLLVMASLSIFGWLFTRDENTSLAVQVLVSTLGVAIVACCASLLGTRPLSLRWDGQIWHIGPAATVGEEPWRGDLAVALDLDGWLLLRFRHAPGLYRWRRFMWLPVQHQGLEAQWHALRCAVYSARPDDPGARTRSAMVHDSKNERS